MRRIRRPISFDPVNAIKDKKIENYQLVVPSTWNASPRDAKGQRSAYEAFALISSLAILPSRIMITRFACSAMSRSACGRARVGRKPRRAGSFL